MSFKLKLLVIPLYVTMAGLLLVVYVSDLSQLQFQDLCACNSCLSENNGMLSGRLNRSVELVLSSKTNLSEEAFRWWKVMVINPAFIKYSHETWLEKKGAYPSTGFMTLIFALHVCDEVHVFGFGADNNGNWSHYFEELTDKNFKSGEHPGNDEYDIIQELAKEKTEILQRVVIVPLFHTNK